MIEPRLCESSQLSLFLKVNVNSPVTKHISGFGLPPFAVIQIINQMKTLRKDGRILIEKRICHQEYPFKNI